MATMQRIPFGQFSRLLVGGSHKQLVRNFTVGRATQDVRDHKHSASEIKRAVPEFWVRKMKTLFAFCDRDRDGFLTEKDYNLFAEQRREWWKKLRPGPVPANVASPGQAKLSKRPLGIQWLISYCAGTEEEIKKVDEDQFIEIFFRGVHRSDAKEHFRIGAKELFDSVATSDGKGDKKICDREGDFLMRAGDPWSIVGFSAVDTNSKGYFTKDEFEQTYMNFFFNFADEAHPSKHFFGVLVK